MNPTEVITVIMLCTFWLAVIFIATVLALQKEANMPHQPLWSENPTDSDDKIIIFECDMIGCSITHPIVRSLYERGTAYPPLTEHMNP